jgi:WD40 repeat protein
VIAVGAGKLIIPPACNSYFAWGFPDFSGRILALDTDKVLAIREGMHEGPINCVAITEDGKILITGGCDTVVAVHKIQDGKVRRINFVYNLCNHLAPVVSVAVSRAFSIVVSASEDQECFLWDLNRLKFIRQLTHKAPKTESSLHTVVINEANGDIVGCSSFWLHLWSVNGNLLLSKRMSSLVSDSVTAFAFTKVPGWTDKYVLLTGHRDGVIKVRSNSQ